MKKETIDPPKMSDSGFIGYLEGKSNLSEMG